MRHYVTATLAAALLAPAAAEAAPNPACQHVLTDPAHDTHESLTQLKQPYDEPGADLLALDLGSDTTTLTISTTIADVDAPMTTAPMGRSVWVRFRVRETSFLAKHVEGVDASYGTLWVEVDQGAWSGTKRVAYIPYAVDVPRNQVRLEVPLSLLSEHAGTLATNEWITVRSVSTYDVKGLSEYNQSSTIDTSAPAYGAWQLGSQSCA